MNLLAYAHTIFWFACVVKSTSLVYQNEKILSQNAIGHVEKFNSGILISVWKSCNKRCVTRLTQSSFHEQLMKKFNLNWIWISRKFDLLNLFLFPSMIFIRIFIGELCVWNLSPLAFKILHKKNEKLIKIKISGSLFGRGTLIN